MKIRAQQFLVSLCVALSSSILFSRDHNLAGRRLGNSGWLVQAFSLALSPNLLPCSCGCKVVGACHGWRYHQWRNFNNLLKPTNTSSTGKAEYVDSQMVLPLIKKVDWRLENTVHSPTSDEGGTMKFLLWMWNTGPIL